jgi:hypothetical protein
LNLLLFEEIFLSPALFPVKKNYRDVNAMQILPVNKIGTLKWGLAPFFNIL